MLALLLCYGAHAQYTEARRNGRCHLSLNGKFHTATRSATSALGSNSRRLPLKLNEIMLCTRNRSCLRLEVPTIDRQMRRRFSMSLMQGCFIFRFG